MDILNLPIVQVYQEGRKWKWKVTHRHEGTVIGCSVEKFDKKQECLDNLRIIGRLVSAWVTAQESQDQGKGSRQD